MQTTNIEQSTIILDSLRANIMQMERELKNSSRGKAKAAIEAELANISTGEDDDEILECYGQAMGKIDLALEIGLIIPEEAGNYRNQAGAAHDEAIGC